MSKLPSLRTWFIASAVTFLSRAFLYSIWVSRGPEVKAALQLDNAGMGLLVMLYPLGGLAGIAFAERLRARIGSKALTLLSFGISAAAMVGLAFTIPAANVVLSGALLFIMGLPMAIVDFVQNFEATAVNARSPRSLMPAIHSAFGVGLMLGAAASNLFIGAGIDIRTSYLITAVVVLIPAIWASSVFPKDEDVVASEQRGAAESTAAASAPAKLKSPWTEKRTLLIAFVGLTFIMAEVSAATWVPIALVQSGTSASEAATALAGFWLVVTLGRAVGGMIVDRIGRHNTIRISAISIVIGVTIFALTPLIHLPYLGLLLWSAGMSAGFPLSVASMGDDPIHAPKRINMIIAVVYITSVTVGPVLGSLGQAVGIFIAFGVPIALSAAAVVLSPVTREAA